MPDPVDSSEFVHRDDINFYKVVASLQIGDEIEVKWASEETKPRRIEIGVSYDLWQGRLTGVSYYHYGCPDEGETNVLVDAIRIVKRAGKLDPETTNTNNKQNPTKEN